MTFSRGVLAVAVASGVLLASARVTTAEAPPESDPVLRSLLDEALARNPELAAAREALVAAQQRPAQAGSRPGPMVGVFYQNDGAAPSLGREPMSMLGVSAGQDLPYPGKLSLRRRIAEADAETAALELERARLSLVAAVKQAYYGLRLARGLAALAVEQREIWQEVQETARVRYASAVGSQQDLLRSQVEATRLHALHAQHHAESRARLAELNGLLGRAPDTPVETPGAPVLAPERRPAAELVAWTEANSPELKSAALAVQRDERAVELARLESKPDFNVQGGVMYRGSLPGMWQASASLVLPSRTRARAALAEAQARLSASRARLEGVRVRLRAVAEQRLALLDAASQIEATYREGVIPQGQFAVESATARYAAGQGAQLAVLESVAALLDDRTDYLRLVAAHEAERARLEAASLEPPVGIDSLLMHGRSTASGGGSMGRPADPGPIVGGTTTSASIQMR